MTALPNTTPATPLVFIPQTSSVPIPNPSSVPPAHEGGEQMPLSSARPHQKPESTFPIPKLRLEVRDLKHAGSKAFLSSVVPSTAMEFAVQRSLELLYITPHRPTTTVPGTRSITLILRSMGGVAYTTGVELDDDHKEIHFSVEYIDGIPSPRKPDEILGVLTHEVVHCYQYNAHGTCPGGLIEGIADWVRLNSNLSPPHWERDTSGKWDAGYQHTAYFLDYLEKRYGDGTISKMNDKLRIGTYNEKRFWTELLGRPVEQLWTDYVEAVAKEDDLRNDSTIESHPAKNEDDEMVLVEKEDAHVIEKSGTEAESTTPTPMTPRSPANTK